MSLPQSQDCRCQAAYIREKYKYCSIYLNGNSSHRKLSKEGWVALWAHTYETWPLSSPISTFKFYRLKFQRTTLGIVQAQSSNYKPTQSSIINMPASVRPDDSKFHQHPRQTRSHRFTAQPSGPQRLRLTAPNPLRRLTFRSPRHVQLNQQRSRSRSTLRSPKKRKLEAISENVSDFSNILNL